MKFVLTREWNAECLEQDQYSNAQITLCPGTNNTYCCGYNNTACCDTDFAISISGAVGGNEMSTGTSSLGSSSPTGTSTTSFTPTSSPKSGLSTGAKAGIAIGGVAVVLFAVTAVLFFIGRRKKNNKTKVAETIETPVEEEDKRIVVTVIERPVPHFEFSGDTPDLHSYAGTWELPDRNIEAKELDTNLPRRR